MLCPWGAQVATHRHLTDVLPSLKALPPATFHSIPRPSRKADTHVLGSATRVGGALLSLSAGATLPRGLRAARL